MSQPVFVTGCPRSRTSLTMDILQRCGLFLGNICGPTKFNKRGQFENVQIVNEIEKPYLRKIGADPKMQKPLPKYTDLIPDPGRRKNVLNIMKNQGLKNQPAWGFKICKAVGDWPIWAEAFPEATWIIVRRRADEILDSVKKVDFMTNRNTRKSWLEWVEYHLKRFDDMKKQLKYYEVWSDNFLKGDYSELYFLPEVGLELTEKAQNRVDMSITKFNP